MEQNTITKPQPTPIGNTTTHPVPPVQTLKPQQNTQSVQTPKPLSEQKNMLTRRRPGVLLLGRTQFSLFIQGTPSVVSYPYPQTVVRDLDVVDETVLIQQITDLIQKNQLPSASFYAVFANPTIFARQIMAIDASQKKAEEEKFVSTVPFEQVSIKHVTMDGKTYVVAANKHFYEMLAKAFAKNGSEITLILPEFLLTRDVSLGQGLNPTIAESLLHRMPSYREYNFIQKEAVSGPTGMPGEEQQNDKFKLKVSGGKSNRVFVLAGVFVMLLGVLLVVYLLTQQRTSPKPTSVQQSVVAPTPVPVASSSADTSSSGQQASSSGNVQGATSPTITVVYNHQELIQANALRSRLGQLGYTAVTLQEASIVAPKTYVVFNNYLPQNLRSIITDTVNGIVGNASAYETTGATSDVVITLASKMK